jgi:hypothetical protein
MIQKKFGDYVTPKNFFGYEGQITHGAKPPTLISLVAQDPFQS